jgi:hypothetical protein
LDGEALLVLGLIPGDRSRQRCVAEQCGPVDKADEAGGGRRESGDRDLLYDPLLARFGTPDPTTESPFSTQGWNRYSYVGNSPLNFTDPSGYCFMGCFWKPIFRAIGNFVRQNWGSIFQIAVTAICAATPGCQAFLPLVAGLASTFVTGVSSGSLGLALKAGFISAVTAMAFTQIGDLTGGFDGADPLNGGHGPLEFGSAAHLFNMAGHALVGCGSALASGGKCGPGALSGAAGSFAGPLMKDLNFEAKLVATSVVGGVASVAGGGKFANGAVTAAFGYLFNEGGRELLKYREVPDHPYVMTPEFRAAFGGSQDEANFVATIAEIESGSRPSYEPLKARDLLLPGRSDTFYEVYTVIPADNDSPGESRIAHIPGSDTYYYSPYHYKPGPGAPNVWFLFTIDRCTVYGIC